MKRILLVLILFLCSVNFLSAQEGAYVVTRKADKIPVYNHDREIVGHLRPGDRIFVTLFHQVLPNDDQLTEPITFVEYKGQECILFLESADWMKCIQKTAVDLDELETTAPPDPSQSIPFLLIVGIVNLLVLLYLAKFRNVISWEMRDRAFRKGAALIPGLALLTVFSAEFYYLYRAVNPFWFCQWEHAGFLGMIAGLAGMIVLLYIQLTVLLIVISALAYTRKPNARYFDYGTSFLVAFVGTWLILIVDGWEVLWKENLQIGIVIAVSSFLLYKVRHVIRERSLISGLLIVLLFLTGVSTLCYASLEVFRRIFELVALVYIIRFCIQGIGNKNFQWNHEGEDYVDYYDYREGKSRRLYHDGGGNYTDYSDGSNWGKRGDTGDFNRYN